MEKYRYDDKLTYEKFVNGPYQDDWVYKYNVHMSPDFIGASVAYAAYGNRLGTGHNNGLEGGAQLIELGDLSATCWRVTVQDENGDWHRIDNPRRVRIEVAGSSEVTNLRDCIAWLDQKLSLVVWDPSYLQFEERVYKQYGLLDKGKEISQLIKLLKLRKKEREDMRSEQIKNDQSNTGVKDR